MISPIVDRIGMHNYHFTSVLTDAHDQLGVKALIECTWPVVVREVLTISIE